MTLPSALLSTLLALSLLAGCQTTGNQAQTHALSKQRIELHDRPQSSLMALIRILEALDALQSPDVEVRIRALECDTLPAQREQPPHVRVILDLTLYAVDYALVEAAQEALLAGLREEGRATARTGMLASHRIRRVFDEMPWNAPKVRGERDFAGLVSISSSFQIEVYAAEGQEPLARQLEATEASAPASQNVEDYIKRVASTESIQMGSLRVDLSPQRLRDQRTDLNYRIQPLRQGDSFKRHQIGSFLFELERCSPGVRITHLEIAPSDPGQDLRYDLWSFSADLTLRLSRSPAP